MLFEGVRRSLSRISGDVGLLASGLRAEVGARHPERLFVVARASVACQKEK